MLRLFWQPALSERVLFQFLRFQDAVWVVWTCRAARHLKYRPVRFSIGDPREWSSPTLDTSAIRFLELGSEPSELAFPRSLHVLRYRFPGHVPQGQDFSGLALLHTFEAPIFLTAAIIDLLERECPLLRTLACTGVQKDADERLGQMQLDSFSLIISVPSRRLPMTLTTLRMACVRDVDMVLQLTGLKVLVLKTQGLGIRLLDLQPLNSLETLFLQKVRIDFEFIIGPPPLSSRLTKLCLPACSLENATETLDLRHLHQLEELDLDGMGDRVLHLPASLARLKVEMGRLVFAQPAALVNFHYRPGGTGIDTPLPNVRSFTLEARGLDLTTVISLLTSFPLLDSLDVRGLLSWRLLRSSRVLAVISRLSSLRVDASIALSKDFFLALGPQLRRLELNYPRDYVPGLDANKLAVLSERLLHLKVGTKIFKSDLRELSMNEKFLAI